MLIEISEIDLLNSPVLFGNLNLLNKFKKVSDVIFCDDPHDEELLREIDVTGTFLLYGKTGTGKTTLAYEVMKYVQEKYYVTPYRIDTASIITSALGETLKNFESVFRDIRNKSTCGVLVLLDEFDRFVVDRGSKVEISELKRSLLSIMDFFSSLKYSDKIMVIAVTNYKDSIDSALLRRFSFIDEVDITNKEIHDYYKFKKDLYIKNGISLNDSEIENCNTISELKNELRKKYIGEV